jgi:DNA (cytosine-5)-methyltransferase 1
MLGAMSAYYNEIDPFAAAWLRELIKAGHIAPGVVDERSIEDVLPSELTGFDQCHFFAGIGVWSHALRRAGWPDDRPVWTGSCPCQPFSTAGKRKGTADERHLWPSWFHLIEQCKPNVIFGEQVEAAIRDAWLDCVQADLEGIDYRVGATVLPAAGFGAPHLRHRLYFVADERHSGMADALRPGPQELGRNGSNQPHSGQLRPCAIGGMAESDLHCDGSVRPRETKGVSGIDRPNVFSAGELSRANGATRGFWRDAEWLYCRDEKFRPVEPGSFPLVNGTPARVGRLRGYGNAIVAEVAKEFIAAYQSVQ